MADQLGSDLTDADIICWFGFYLCVGVAEGKIFVERSGNDDLEMDEMIANSGVYRKKVCDGGSDPALTVAPDGIVRVEVVRGGRLYHYKVPQWDKPAVLIDTT